MNAERVTSRWCWNRADGARHGMRVRPPLARSSSLAQRRERCGAGGAARLAAAIARTSWGQSRTPAARRSKGGLRHLAGSAQSDRPGQARTNPWCPCRVGHRRSNTHERRPPRTRQTWRPDRGQRCRRRQSPRQDRLGRSGAGRQGGRGWRERQRAGLAPALKAQGASQMGPPAPASGDVAKQTPRPVARQASIAIRVPAAPLPNLGINPQAEATKPAEPG